LEKGKSLVIILQRSTLSNLIFELNTENKEFYLTIKNNAIQAAWTNDFVTSHG
jgi:hypothetical protein